MKIFIIVLICIITCLETSQIYCQTDSIKVHLKNSQIKTFSANGISIYFVDKTSKTFSTKDISTIYFQTDVSFKDCIGNSLLVYPNPLVNHSNLMINGLEIGMNNIQIFNERGKLIRKFKFLASDQNNSASWDGKDMLGNYLSNGTYILLVDNKNSQITGKIIIIK